MSIPRLGSFQDSNRAQRKSQLTRPTPRESNSSARSTFVRDDKTQQRRLIAQSNTQTRQQDDVEFQTTFWRDVEWNGLSIRIYKDYKQDNEHKYYVFPSLRIVGQSTASLARNVGQKDVYVTFEFLPPELRERLLEEIVKYSGKIAKEKINIGLIPMNSIEIKSTNGCRWGMGLNSAPGNSMIILQPGDRRLRFRCSNENEAKSFVETVKNGDADLRVKIGARGKEVSKLSVEIRVNQVTERDFENDLNPGQKLDSSNQYFSARQVATVLENALDNHEIRVREEGNIRGKYILPTEFKSLLRNFLKHAFVKETVDLDKMTRLYVGKKNYSPNVVNEESKSANEAYQRFVQNLFGDLKQLANSGSQSSFDRNVNDSFKRNFSHEFGSKTSSGSQSVMQIDKDGFAKGSASESHTEQASITKDEINKLYTDVTKAGAQSFSNASLDIIKRYTTQALNRSGSTQWAFKGERIYPRKIQVYRLVKARLGSRKVISYAHETVVTARQPITFERNSEQDRVIKGRDLLSSQQIGSIIPFSAGTPPQQWKKCEGQELTLNSNHDLVRRAQGVNTDLKLSDGPSGMKIITLPNRPGYIIKTGNVDN